MNNSISKYSAAPSLIGYLYQCRLALLESLRRLKTNPCLAVSIETLDDVVFEDRGTPKEILQVKHHVNHKASLTDSNNDLWKSIQIWIDLHQNGVAPSETIYCIMTTAEAPEGSAAYYLRSMTRDMDTAEKKLIQIAQKSKNKNNKQVYCSFLSMSEDLRHELLESVFIYDNCPQCDDLDQQLQEELYYACQRPKIEQFQTYLEGWWFQRILKSFYADQPQPIIAEELDSHINELREQFKSDALPIYDELKTATVDQELYQHYKFVHQLNLIGVKSRRISNAVNNYYRAFQQRSRWVREDLILTGDIEDYENKLIEEWEIRFEAMREEIGDDAAEKEKIKAAREIYAWVEQDANFPIRKRCHEEFITRGSYQILSDELKVGWHPEFTSRLADILGVKETVK